MTLADLVLTSRRVAETRSRLEKVEHLAACLRALAASEVPMAVAYLSGELGQGRIGVGYSMVSQARGAPAVAAAPLTLGEVDRTLGRIQATSGAGSAAERGRLLAALMGRASSEERDFLARLLVGELRQGALEGVMADALARAAGVPLADVRRALMLGDRGEVATAVLGEGKSGLARFSLAPLTPVQPMLAETAKSVEQAMELLGEAALDFKLDGARIQAHRLGDEVRVFTRALNDITAAVPEVVEAMLKLPSRELILDGEALVLRKDGRPEAFQTTMRRFGRRLDLAALRAKLPLSPFFFDLLHAGGESFLDQPAAERFAALAGLVPAEQVVARLRTADAAAAGGFLARALQSGHEGIVAKALGAPYAAGARGAGWLKVKPANTLDLVVLAVEWGSGRRKGLLSNLHLGARDPRSGGFVMLGKTFKGMTDEMLAWQTEKLLALQTSRQGHVVEVQPRLVVEVAFDGVQQSPHYPGGLALRFARVKRYREDKTAAEADTIDTVAQLHARSSGPAEAG